MPAAAPPASRHGAVFGRMARNIAWLLGGKGFSGIVSLIYIGVAARALGPAPFGVFSLVLAYAQTLANIAQFQSGQAMIRYGALHLRGGRARRLARLIGFGFVADSAAAILGAIVAAAGVTLAGRWVHWPAGTGHEAAWFGAVLLLTTGSTANGLLRLLDRFDLLTGCEASGPAIRFVGVMAAWWTGAGIKGFLIVWAAAPVGQALLTWIAALFVLKGRGIGIHVGWRAGRIALAENRRLWRFLWQSNVSITLSSLWPEIGVLAVGGAGGAAAAGGFRVAAKLAKALTRPVQTIAKALLPELAHLVAAEDGATLGIVVRRLTLGSVLLAVLIALIAAFAGPLLLQLLAGRAYRFASLFLLLLAIAAGIDLARFALEPLLVARGQVGRLLGAQAIGTAIYGAALALLIPRLGPVGAAVAAIAGSLVLTVTVGFAALRTGGRRAA